VNSAAAVRLTTGLLAHRRDQPGLRRAEALHRAMLGMLDDPAPSAMAHPYYWAPFLVVGEGGPLGGPPRASALFP
jgi:hypothetical protein